ncbi:SGNH/GDSL hydrolase family protein [Streptomyces beihaiensis]|uniref:SGNH/GDSL hydrolase family protein n=1 Tax=Streptomyces beihaiensis TaxID=2984495 RepID=A0ABT3TSI7_9ACTN|nr:SGNH/GDSL hydrolase family protein [Streptomyces beihaiensis]MCX3059996.1 SGNH/GDSL hydrolase family protein [Streptomyces beihaiensis]
MGVRRTRGNRPNTVRAVAGVVAAAALGVSALTGCDASGGNSPASSGSTAGGPSPKSAAVWDTRPRSIAAVGDSITRGFDACTVLSDCPEASWATGSDPRVDSLAVRLLGKGRARTHSWNLARTGARMADLSGQMARAGARNPDLVTVMAGANDACRPTVASMTPVTEFRSEFETALHRLRQEAPQAQVYVMSVPNLKRLWSQGRNNPLGKEVWRLGICSSMLADPDDLTAAATERRASVQERVEEYNRVLKSVCAKDERCRYDGGAVFGYRFGEEQLSHWDWFHPSRDGQARLAALAYRGVTAKEPPS